MKHGDAAVLVGLGLVILLQTASVVMLIADADPVALPPVVTATNLQAISIDTTAPATILGPPDTTAPLAVPAEATITTGPMDRDADGYSPLDVAPLPARLDGTPTTEYALIELPKGTDQLVIEIQMLERSRGNE